jgi:hypothetical protein
MDARLSEGLDNNTCARERQANVDDEYGHRTDDMMGRKAGLLYLCWNRTLFNVCGFKKALMRFRP